MVFFDTDMQTSTRQEVIIGAVCMLSLWAWISLVYMHSGVIEEGGRCVGMVTTLLLKQLICFYSDVLLLLFVDAVSRIMQGACYTGNLYLYFTTSQVTP